MSIVDEAPQNDAESSFTAEELEILAEIDSSLYGFLKLNVPENSKKKTLIIKAVKCLERVLTFYQVKKSEKQTFRKRQMEGNSLYISNASVNENKNADIPAENINETENEDPLLTSENCIKIYCKLGHFNLLLEDYPKALSAYQKYYSLKEDHYKNPAFMYGLGLTYFHFKAFKWAIKTFRYLLYLDSGYIRSNEVHLRLAIAFKVLQDFESSYKHFQLVLVDSNPCSFSKAEIYFHIGHLFEVQGKHKAAKEIYEQLLEQKDIPQIIRAEASKNLGWMHHTVDCIADKFQRERETSSLSTFSAKINLN